MTQQEYLTLAAAVNKIRDDARTGADAQVADMMKDLVPIQKSTLAQFCAALKSESMADADEVARAQKAAADAAIAEAKVTP